MPGQSGYLMRLRIMSTASMPMADRDMRMVVSAGMVTALKGISSKPMMDMSSGMLYPASRMALTAPMATVSLSATTAPCGT